MKLLYPLKEISVNQPFGANPAYYAKFGWRGHNGIDFKAAHGTPVYASHDGNAFYVTDIHGGDGIYVRSLDKTYNTIYWHLCSKDDPQFKPLIAPTGIYPVKAGDKLGYADNTGAPYESSGDHLHFGLMPLDPNTLLPLNPDNGFGGCTDPAAFFITPEAEDANAVSQLVIATAKLADAIPQANVNQKNTILSLLLKVAAFLQSL